MKKMALFAVFCVLFSCDDGDLQIEGIDFDSSTIQFCTSPTTASNNVLFKINEDEALILDLQSGALQNQATTDTIVSTVPGQSTLTYRIFSDNVTTNYFCDDIPPSTPTVVEEIPAEGGEVLITTLRSETDTTMYEHTIRLKGISLVNSIGERITDLTIDEFGTVTTQE